MDDDKRAGSDPGELEPDRFDPDFAGPAHAGAHHSDPVHRDPHHSGPHRADPTELEISAIFAAALADEPPSRVTAESVLREVYEPGRTASRRFGEWLRSGSWSLKWAGGLVAVAAVVGAVFVVAPMMGGAGTDSATSAADTRIAYESESDEMADGAVPQPGDAAGSRPDAEAEEMGELSLEDRESSQSDADAMTALSADSADSADNVDSAGSAEATAQASPEPPNSALAADGSAEDEAAAGGSSAGGSGEGEMSSSSCDLPPLTDAEWSAALAELPAGFTTQRLAGASCHLDALRGNGIEVDRGESAPATYLWVVLSTGSIGRDGAADDSLVRNASHDGVTVTVIANQSGDPWLDGEILQRLVDAIASAST